MSTTLTAPTHLARVRPPRIGDVVYRFQGQLGELNPVGLFDLNRNPRPVAQAYRQLLDLFGNEPLLGSTDVLQLTESGAEL